MMQFLRSTLCIFTLVSSASALAGQNILYYLSQPGDFLGLGAEVTFKGTDGTFSVGASSSTLSARFFSTDGSHGWGLALSTANGAPLQVGAYENAQRFSSATNPGLDFSGDGRGCNTVTGRFDVFELVRDATGAITQLAVNWEEHCDGMAPALLGQYRFNSDVPVIRGIRIALDTPLNFRGCVEATSPQGAPVSMDANSVTDATGGTSLLYSWSSTTGDVGTASVFGFNAPLTTDPANPVVVTLSVTDLTNNTVATTTKSVCVSDTTPPTIVINSPVPGQVAHGDTLILDVTIKDAVDKNITQYSVSMGSNFTSPISPTSGHARQNILAAPKANGSIGMTITVFAIDASGNFGQSSVTVSDVP